MNQNKIFESASSDSVRKSAFDLSHTKALSGKMGNLIPTLVQEVIPGDEFNIQQENFVRLAPLLAPVMHMINITTHFFFVPNRIIWTEWEDFITGGKDGTSAPTMPTYPLDSNVSVSSRQKLMDYMGLPLSTLGTSNLDISLLSFAAYNLIYEEYYRDPTLTPNTTWNSPATLAGDYIFGLKKSSWQKDYFTSALPFLQRGPEIGVPIELEYRAQTDVRLTTGGATAADYTALNTNPSGGLTALSPSSARENVYIDNIDSTLDFTINELRTSSALQRFMEKQATGGYRYTETLRNHFNITSSDARLQRPEYLGGGKNPVMITEVLSNTETLNTTDDVTTPVGEMAGHGVSQGQTIAANFKAEEHGFILGITRILPDTQYFQGIPKHFLYDDKFDYAWPELANLGEQPVLNCELYYDPNDDNYNNATFGYQQRYSQYKFAPSTVHGDFRTSLKYWHMAREFSSQPALNAAFVAADPTNRIFAVQDGTDDIWIQILNKVKAIRPLPYFANPQLR